MNNPTRRQRIHCILLLLAGLTAPALKASQQVSSHSQLQDALKANQPPSGYIDLNRCSTAASIGNLPEDRQTYRLSFSDQFSFNLQSRIITSVGDTLMNNSQMVEGIPVLVKVPATVFVSSAPDNNFLRYQISIQHEQNTWIKVYHCPWNTAVFLWRQGDTEKQD